jgi:hypothetical protein
MDRYFFPVVSDKMVSISSNSGGRQKKFEFCGQIPLYMAYAAAIIPRNRRSCGKEPTARRLERSGSEGTL